MKPSIKITVTGFDNTGKTTVAEAIRQALVEAGISVTVQDPDTETAAKRLVVKNYQQRRLATLSERGLEVTVEVEEMPRPPKSNVISLPRPNPETGPNKALAAA